MPAVMTKQQKRMPALAARPAIANAPAAIKLEQVSVRYRVPHERIASFKEYAINTLLRRRLRYHDFFALREVSLEVGAGEIFGVVGRNGAGKSTLLKVVSRVIKPHQGRLWMRGRVAPLLELGAGFHPELSGRENVFLNGTLLGYTRAEVEKLFSEIVDFAEVHEFIDAPLRTYSSGMQARLGFAVATAQRPDILLVDEVLSVGDERFQEKCFARMDDFRRGGTTILLVSHSGEFVRAFCDRAVWLDHGQIRALGAADQVITSYQSLG
jgi:ABC-type polysaccharide/polyol phosphate transport system ATPase subunit